MRASDDAKRKRSPPPPPTLPPSPPSPSVDGSTDPNSPQRKRNKWARLLLRELYDLGFNDAAAALEREACVQLRSSVMKKLQNLVASRQWDEALQLVMKTGDEREQLQMKSTLAAREAALLLLQRKFIDFLLLKQLPEALRTFQEEILPLCEPSEAEVKQLAELLLCRDADEMKQRTSRPWQDDELQLKLEELVSPEEIIPEGALRRIVQDVELQTPPPMMMGQVAGDCVEVLTSHKNDVWELAFSPDGEMLASASSDGSVVLWEIKWKEEAVGFSLTMELKTETLHVLQSLEGPADCLAWSPDSRFLLSSGSRSSTIQLWDRTSGLCEKRFQHPGGVVTKMQWLSCGDQFVSGSADKSLVLWNANENSIAYQWSGRRVLDVVVHPHDSKVFVLISGYEIRVYDVAHKSDELFIEADNVMSCLTISPSGKFLLVNFVKQEQLTCIEIATGSVVAKYHGIREQRYVLRPCFIGAHSELVASGSEDGKIHVWQRDNGKLAAELDGHSSVVNVVVRHPVHASVMASASDDKTDSTAMQATYDTWQRAYSVEHFNKLCRGERRMQNNAVGRLCLRSLRLFKQLPNSPVTWLYLMILGSLAAVYGLLFDGWVRALLELRDYIIKSAGEYSFGAFIIWTMWCVGFGMLATCCGYYISPASDGSGIPTMRGLFAGVFQNPGDTLSFRTLVARSIGTVLSSASALSVGRSGPFTHIMAIIGYLMGKISIFQRVNYGQQNYNFIRAAVACGVTASFGSPLGGVLFGIEVTAKYYEIKCLWEGIICSSFCILVFNIITFTKSEVLFERTKFTGFDMDEEIFAFVLLGIITGIGAGLYCKMALVLRRIQARLLERFRLTKPSIQRRIFHVVSICLTTALISFPFGIMRIPDRVMINELFRDQTLSFPQWTQFSDSKHVTLVIYIVLKLFISILPCGAPLSCGVFGPLFTMGAAVGRYYGETLMELWSPHQSPATYAVVGAACFAASATQTVSTAVIFFELTGQLSHMVPVMVACIAAYFVSGIITPSIYDILASWAGMNSVCYDFNEHVLSQKAAKDYMATVPVIFTRDTTYEEAIQALNTFKKEEYFPVCDNAENKLLMGCLRRYDLEVGIARFLAVHRSGKEESKNAQVSTKIQNLISQVLDIDKKKSATVDNVSLLNFQPKETPTTSSMLELGPPFDEYEFTSIPVESYPPQVGEDVNLYRVHKLASISSWTQVYVVKFGKLQGVIHLDSSLTKLRKEDVPIRFS
ncbi:hypothetical protein L917_17978 [Phytophthora nicotianae]|uniref:Chloride channel protein n=1 Tax=Phytophthora nicotianae TaxID=4792 RepID=W2K9G8_PHYNI|nr:hypothetical protein L917_17978 [Phytophthora nicotianae]